MNIDIYYHCHCGPSWARYFTDFFNHLKRSGLYDIANRIYICCDGDFQYKDDKFHISRHQDVFVDEFPTLRMMRDNANHYEGSALYYRIVDESDAEALNHYLIYGYHECLGVLADRDVVGINLDKNNAGYWFFEENCWWARYEYLRGLDMDVGRARLWVLSKAEKNRISCLNQKKNR